MLLRLVQLCASRRYACSPGSLAQSLLHLQSFGTMAEPSPKKAKTDGYTHTKEVGTCLLSRLNLRGVWSSCHPGISSPFVACLPAGLH